MVHPSRCSQRPGVGGEMWEQGGKCSGSPFSPPSYLGAKCDIMDGVVLNGWPLHPAAATRIPGRAGGGNVGAPRCFKLALNLLDKIINSNSGVLLVCGGWEGGVMALSKSC